MKSSPVIIITGYSGSGKSTALNALEDAGFYCVDNMPVTLLPKFLDLPKDADNDFSGFAFVMDLREKGFLSGHTSVLSELSSRGHDFSIIFLEADKDVLVRRYSQTRRYHPLSKHGNVLEGIETEISQLKAVRESANIVIDTSRFNVHELKSAIFRLTAGYCRSGFFRISVQSFGFKHGAPVNADLVMDVRFLANPYFVPELKALTGEHPDVREYVLDNDTAREFMAKYTDILDFLIPLYKKEGKTYLTVAVGCTGGKHRSVAVSEALYNHIRKQEKNTDIIHRDIDR